MHRIALEALKKWKNRPIRSPLLIRGARQVGKTFLVESFGKQAFKNLVSINFELQFEYVSIFKELEPHNLIQRLEFLSRQKIVPGETLLFLDEIQQCPAAIQALRYFKEQLPNLHVIGAGSLLEFVLHDAKFSIPVGRLEFLYLKPLSFREYLIAREKHDWIECLQEVSIKNNIPEPLHVKLLQAVREYLVLGGMPAVIYYYLTQHDLEYCEQLQSFLLQTYRDDFGKYAAKTQYNHLQQIFHKLPHIIAKQFKYIDLARELRAEETRKALKLLNYAGLLTQVNANSAAGLPLAASQKEKQFKMLFLDVGLWNRANSVPSKMLLDTSQSLLSRGQISEQFVGQELLTIQPNYQPSELYYWYRDKSGSNAEVDYLTSLENQIIPLEVKSTHNNRLKSLHTLMQERKLPLGIKISEDLLNYHNNILSVPLYMIEELPRLINLGQALLN